MLELLDPVAATTTKTSTLSWQAVALTGMALGFAAFALWLFASEFDGSEIKSLLLMAGPVAMREFWPIVKRLLAGPTNTLSKGTAE